MPEGGCAASSRACGESTFGTASLARRWILVEQPGAWGRDALADSDLPATISTHLRELAATLPARVLLLRRPGGASRSDAARTVYAGVSRPAGSWLERLDLDHVDDLVDLGFDGLTDGDTVGGQRVLEPLYLVCTNGKHDVCCTEHGLPVARELAGRLPHRVWECSHVGGDRFAGNLVCLPEGSFYGQLDPASARAVVAAHEEGRILLDHWRGRSSIPFAAQAAEALVRRALDVDRAEGLRVTHVERDGNRHEVRLARPDGSAIAATVAVDRTASPRALTCAGSPAVAPAYSLESLRTEG